jgi:site-specific DNA recombinase
VKLKKLTDGAVHYTRVSTKEQAEDPANLATQKRICSSHGERQGWPVVECFEDIDSARTALDRPGFQRMVAYCLANRHRVRYLLVQDLSRFARNIKDQAVTLSKLEAIGVLVRSVMEPNINETAAGRMAATIHGAFNQFFSDSLSEKMQERTRQSAAAGRYPWRAPIGFRNVGGQMGPNIVPDEHAGPLIKRAFELMSTGSYSKVKVLQIITGEGLTTARGMPLTPQTFHVLLRNPLFAGWVTLPSDDSFKPVRGLHQPLINQELFDRVQAVLDGRRIPSAPKQKVNPAFPLKLFVRCDSCGVPLTGGSCKGRSKRYEYYWCRNQNCRAVKLTAHKLEADFLALVQRLSPRKDAVLATPAVAAKLLTAAQGNTEREIKRMQDRLEEARHRRRQLLESMLDKKISDETYRETDADYGRQIVVTEEEIRALSSLQITRDQCLQFDQLLMANIAGAWELASPDQRQVVQTLLFSDGLSYSPAKGILNRSKASLFNTLEFMRFQKVSLASPTGFEPVLPP